MGYIEGIMISACINIVCVAGLAILTGYIGLFLWDMLVFCVLEHIQQGFLRNFMGYLTLSLFLEAE